MDDGVYLAADELDVHGTHLFTKDGYPNWRIRNDFGCGWRWGGGGGGGMKIS